MGRRKRRQSRAGSDPLIRHRDRIASLEHRVAGLAASEKQRQQANAIRTEIHTILLDLKHVPRSPSRDRLILQVRTLLGKLAAPTPSPDRKRELGGRDRQRESGVSVRDLEREVRELVKIRNPKLRHGKEVSPELAKREAKLTEQLRVTAKAIRESRLDRGRKAAYLTRIQRARASLHNKPEAETPPRRTASSTRDPESVRRARVREELEREERERRNQSTSVYTVSGGLPGLGSRR